MPDPDEIFFSEHPDRQLRIRLPEGKESEKEFRSLGDHAYARRRIIVARVAPWLAKLHKLPIMKIPFLAFADESIEDRDDILLPIMQKIMQDAALGYGIPMRRK